MLNLGKGIETDSALLPSEILREVFSGVPSIGTLAGPNIAAEVLAGKYAEATLALKDLDQAAQIAKGFEASALHIRVVSDVRGVEVDAAF